MAQGIRVTDETLRTARRLLERRDRWAGLVDRARAAANGHPDAANGYADYAANLAAMAATEGALAELWAAVLDHGITS